MKRFRSLSIAAIAFGAIVTVLSGTAAAQPDPGVVVSDVQVVVGNAPDAANELAEGLQDTADVLQSTQSAEETAAAFGATFVAVGSTLVDGTEQFGALGLGLLLINQGFQNALSPITVDLIDNRDPQGAAEGAPDFITSLPDAIAEARDGDDVGCSPAEGLAQLLQGNVIDPPLGIGTPAFYSCTVVGPLLALFNASIDTPFEGTFQFLGITSLVVGGAAEPQISGLEEQLAPVFGAISPATGPIIGALEGA